MSFLEKNTEYKGIVYVFKVKNKPIYKIGVTKKKPKERIRSLQTASPYQIMFVKAVASKNPYKLEELLHDFFKDNKLVGEWFKTTKSEINFVFNNLNLLN